MPTIKFNQKWDKLKPDRFKVGNEFTTFRRYKLGKDAYYQREKLSNSVFYVILDEDPEKIKEMEPVLLGTARLKKLEYKWSDQLTLDEMKKDTYQIWDADDFMGFLKKMYGLDIVFGLFLTFEIETTHMQKDGCIDDCMKVRGL